MTDRLPPDLREALDHGFKKERDSDFRPTPIDFRPAIRADRARAMAAALRWARGCIDPLSRGSADVRDAIAALEQEAQGD